MDEINDELQSIENSKTNSNIDSFKDDGKIIETRSQHTSLQHTLDNDLLIKMENIDSSLNDISKNSEIKDNTKIKLSDPQVPIKKNIPKTIILKTLRNQIVSNAQRNNVPLNSKKIQSALSISKINCSNISKLKQGVKITSTKDSSNIIIVPNNGMNYIVNNPSKPLFTSNTESNESSEPKKQILVSQLNDTKKVSQFMTRMQKLPDGKYKMLSPAGNLPAGLENLFNPNSHFIKQKVDSDSVKNEHKVSYFIQSSSVNSNFKETNDIQSGSQVPPKKTNCTKISSISYNNEEIDHSQSELHVSSEETKCVETYLENSITKKVKNIKKELEAYSEESINMETCSITSNNEVTNYNETELQNSHEETNRMKTSSNNCVIKKPKTYQKIPKISSQKIHHINRSLANNHINKINHIQKKLQITSDQMKCIGTPLVDPDILIRIKKETPVSLEYNSEESNNVQKESQENNNMEVSIDSVTDETNHSEKELSISNEKTHSIETPFVNSISEEANHVQKKSQEMHDMETSSSNFKTEKPNDVLKEPQVSSEETNDMEISLADCINEETIDSEIDLKESSEKTNSMHTSLLKYIIEETDDSENNLEASFEETSCMEISPAHSFTKKSDVTLKKPEESSQETNRLGVSPVNSFVGKTYVKKKLPISSEKIKCIGTPLVDPNILIHIKKDIPKYENNSSNTIFKAPDISSFQRHKVIVSRSTTDNKYVMKKVINTNNKIQLKTIENQEPFLSSRSYVRLLPKSQPKIQTNNQPMIINPKSIANSNLKTKVNPNFKNNGKKVFVKILKTNCQSFRRIIPAEEMRKLFPGIVPRPQFEDFEEYPNKNKMPPSKVIQKEKKVKVSIQEEGRKFVSCKNKFCTSLTHDIIQPELIDNKYCSLACKMLDSKKTEILNKPPVVEQPKEDPPKKIVIDRKKLLEKLKNRITKKKQSLSSCYPEKVTCEVQCDDPKVIEIPSSKTSNHYRIIEQQLSLNPSNQIIPKSVEEIESYRKYIQTFSKEVQEMNESTAKYLKEKNFTPAPKKLFDSPFPCEQNCFKVGHKLEGIDPTHEALFCVLTVVEISGYRMKLHFDGYPAIYDFWVNADNPDLFYTNWCLENNRTLQLPRGYKKKFDWYNYFEENGGAIPAPKINFISTKNLSGVYTHKFHVGTKLEALDKMTRTLSKQLICVATVADVLANRIRIHFDGWSNDFDYWTDITSTNLHPIGWCDKNGRNLCPPHGYDDHKGKKPFSWTEYLKETNSKPVSEDAFIRRPLREFTCNMAIEVVDIANPSLIRVAIVVDVKGNELKILYDGFDKKYAYWIDDDSPDIHPIWWCLKTNHPLEIPSSEKFGCKVAGCNGKGNSNCLKPNHFTIKDCPYDFENWEKVVGGLPTLTDRLTLKDLPVKVKRSRKNVHLPDKKKEISKSNKYIQSKKVFEPKEKIIQKQKEKIMQIQKQGLLQKQKPGILSQKQRITPSQKQKIIRNKSKQKDIKKNIIKRKTQIKSKAMIKNQAERLMKVMNDIERQAGRPVEENLYRAHYELKGRVWPEYPFVDLPSPALQNASKWSVEEVGFFVDKLISLNSTYRSPEDEVKYAERFIKRKINGKKFLNLSQDYLTKSMKIPLGSALKISNGIKKLRRGFPDLVFKDESYR